VATVTLRNTKGSALTFSEVDLNFSNLNTDKLEDISADTTPQLGGNLDVNGHGIVSVAGGNIAITPNGAGSIILDGLNWPQADGTADYYLKTNGSGQLSWADPDTDTDTTYTVGALDSGANAIIRLTGSDASTDDVVLVAGTNITITPAGDNITISSTAGGLSNIVEDTSPQLGGNLDVTGYSIVTTADGNIAITPNGNGQVLFSGKKVNNPNLINYKEVINALGSNDTPTIDVGNGNVQSVTITSGLALPAFSSAEAGESVTLLVTGTGAATGTAAYKFAGGNKTLTGFSVVSIFYDGTTYWTSIATGFVA
tara:strand:- start:1578 stop:2513 length:936 start_codon:yes stop_codon:yes gene_type:complete